jgi:DNA polymerase III delta prime subunit
LYNTTLSALRRQKDRDENRFSTRCSENHSTSQGSVIETLVVEVADDRSWDVFKLVKLNSSLMDSFIDTVVYRKIGTSQKELVITLETNINNYFSIFNQNYKNNNL